MDETVVAVVGLGYVGLPLAVAFGRRFETIGYDLERRKIEALARGEDATQQVSQAELAAAKGLRFTHDEAMLARAGFLVVAVPTPVTEAHQPDFGPLLAASATVGRSLRRGATVVYESTVYPGATEEVCVPALEKASGLKWRDDFHVGYSPERMNPSDREHTLERIVKLVAGDELPTTERMAEIYGAIVPAGVHRVSSIRVAEAAKVIENAQRDLNIALVNELALIFHRLGLETREVLAAAATKWNFLPFRPGLVGGHCIGVDPYYLTFKAEMEGYHPQLILAGRRINDGMGAYVAQQTVKELIKAGASVNGARVNVLGLAFKEDCPDIRNSKVADVIRELREFGASVAVHDPIASPEDARREYGIELVPWERLPAADALVAAVSHRQYLERPLTEITAVLRPGGVFVDVKSVYDPQALKNSGFAVWSL